MSDSPQAPTAVHVGPAGSAATTESSGRATFPSGFGWGVATSAYQIEGAVSEDGRKPSIWDGFSERPGVVADGSTGRVACDHYHRYVEDLDLMRRLGVRSYRFSIAWPRVMPDGIGRINPKGLDFYRRLLDGLHKREIAPMTTLYHWDLPQVLQDQGGWNNRDCASWFADYATAMFDALGDLIPTWLTINEPKVIAQQGYLDGQYAPGLKDPAIAGAVSHHLGLGHGLAVQAFRASGRAGRIAPCLNIVPCYPADDSGAATAASTIAETMRNWIYLDPILRGAYPDGLGRLPASFRDGLSAAVRDGDLTIISSPIDFVGVNYYGPAVIDGYGKTAFRYPTTNANWQQVYPNGLYQVLMKFKNEYGNPAISIAENGIPDDAGATVIDDQRRIGYLRDHLLAAHRAVADGAKVEGYHVWSLIDNWEWIKGFTQRWGIVRVQPKTLERTPKSSAAWYAGVIQANGIPL